MYMHVCSLCCLVISSKAKVLMQDVSHESTKPRMSGGVSRSPMRKAQVMRTDLVTHSPRLEATVISAVVTRCPFEAGAKRGVAFEATTT